MLIVSACARLRSAVLSLALLLAVLSRRATSSAMLAASSTAAFTCSKQGHPSSLRTALACDLVKQHPRVNACTECKSQYDVDVSPNALFRNLDTATSKGMSKLLTYSTPEGWTGVKYCLVACVPWENA